MGTLQINKPWNKYETALLIDACEKVSKGSVRRSDAVSRLSKRIREGIMAMDVSISDSFRNEESISEQMSAIENLLKDDNATDVASSRVFADMCDLYANHKEEFDKILVKAADMYPPPRFFDLLSHKNTIAEVFKRKFRNGMRLNSTIDRRKFRSAYTAVSGMSLDDMNDDALVTSIMKHAVLYGHTAYMPELMISDELRRKVVGYIQERFMAGDECVFFEIIFKRFHEEFLESQLLDVDMLRSYLKHINNYGWFFQPDYLSVRERVRPDIEQAVLEYVKGRGGIVTEDEVLDAFPHFPGEAVRHAFQYNPDLLVNCGRGKGKIHINNFHVTTKGLAKVSTLTDKEIARAGYVLWPELMDYIRRVAPDVIDYNEQFGEIGIRKALCAMLDGKYAFNGNVICLRGHVVDAKYVVGSFAKHHPHYTLDDIKQLGEALNASINPYIGELQKYSVRVDGGHFVSKADVKFNVDETDRVISSYCESDYLPLCGISSYLLFPSCGFPWNAFLLESYVFSHSREFCLMHNNFGLTGTLGAIVRRNAGLTFDDVIADALARSGTELSPREAVQYLYDQSYIGQRRLGNVADVIKKARSIRKQLKEE